MFTTIIVITVLIIVLLGIRLVMKLRAVSTWKDNDPVIDGTTKIGLPSDLQELKIEEPTDDISSNPPKGSTQKPSSDGPSKQSS